MHTAESNFTNFVIEYLGEIETEYENTWACLSGAQMEYCRIMEKIEVENLVTHSLLKLAVHQTTLLGGPGPRFEPGTGSLDAN